VRACRPRPYGGKPPCGGTPILCFTVKKPRASSRKRHRVSIDAEPGFEGKVRLLAAKWGVKTNVAVQRAVDLASTRKWSDEEKLLLKSMATRIDQILDLLLAI
jgi:hypothetical protein